MIPIKISNVPEIIDQILLGKLFRLCNFFPSTFPKLKKAS